VHPNCTRRRDRNDSKEGEEEEDVRFTGELVEWPLTIQAVAPGDRIFAGLSTLHELSTLISPATMYNKRKRKVRKLINRKEHPSHHHASCYRIIIIIISFSLFFYNGPPAHSCASIFSFLSNGV
jgi:dolichol kinase